MKHTHTRRARVLTLLLAALLLILPLAACTETPVRDDRTASEVMDEIAAALPTAHRAADADYVCESSFGEDYRSLLDACEDHVILIADDPSNNVDELGVFRVRADADVKAAKKIVSDYIKSQQLRLPDLLDMYNPAEKPKVDEAQVTVMGRYIFYSILSKEDTGKAKEALGQALEVK